MYFFGAANLRARGLLVPLGELLVPGRLALKGLLGGVTPREDMQAPASTSRKPLSGVCASGTQTCKSPLGVNARLLVVALAGVDRRDEIERGPDGARWSSEHISPGVARRGPSGGLGMGVAGLDDNEAVADGAR